MARADYTFRPVTRDDFPMIAAWLREPHVSGWWQSPQTELRLMDEDLDRDVMDLRLVCLEDTPFAYIQDYPAHHWPAPQYADLGPDTRAMDTFLGDPAYLGKGHGAGYLRQRARDLIARGATTVAVDPDPSNLRAVAAYRRAGFREHGLTPCEDGDIVLVMTFPAPRADPTTRPDTP